MIQAETGVQNLTQLMFKSNRAKSANMQANQQGVDSFAKALEQKLEKRLTKQSHTLNKVKEDGNASKEDLTLKNDEKVKPRAKSDRMPTKKVNNGKEPNKIDEKISDLKEELEKTNEKDEKVIESLFVELLSAEALTDDQIIELESILEEFAGLGELNLSQPLINVLEQLPEELLTEIKQLVSESSQGGTLEMISQGKTSGEVDEKIEAFQELIDEILSTIDQTIKELEVQNTDQSKNDLIKVLTLMQEKFGEALNEDGVVKPEIAAQVSESFKNLDMISSIEKKEFTVQLEKLQEMMNQESGSKLKIENVETNISKDGEKTGQEQLKNEVVNSKVLDKYTETTETAKTTETQKDETKQETPKEVEAKTYEGVAKVAEEKNTIDTVLKPEGQALPIEQNLNQIAEVKEVEQVSKIQTTQMARTEQNIMNQVLDASKMSFNLEEGTSEMLIKLKPNSLGNVELKVSIDKGVLIAEFNVESQIVKQVLESNLTDLRNALSDKGFNVHDLNVSVNQDQKEQGYQGNNRQSRKRQKSMGIQSIEKVFSKTSLESYNAVSTIDYLG